MTAIHTTETFWKLADKSAGDTGCWLWQGSLSRKGYGRIRWQRRGMQAHRLAYQLTYGEIPGGLCVCHRCDVRACVNPSHLFLGTVRDNNLDMVAKGRQVTPSGDQHWCRVHPELRPYGDRSPVRRFPEKYRGEHHWKHKVTEAQVREIRARFATGAATRSELAQEYCLKREHLRDILNGRTWRHLETPTVAGMLAIVEVSS